MSNKSAECIKFRGSLHSFYTHFLSFALSSHAPPITRSCNTSGICTTGQQPLAYGIGYTRGRMVPVALLVADI